MSSRFTLMEGCKVMTMDYKIHLFKQHFKIENVFNLKMKTVFKQKLFLNKNCS